MANLIQCDACKIISPTKDNLFIANNWFDILITDKKAKRNTLGTYIPIERILCQQCFNKLPELLTEGIRK